MTRRPLYLHVGTGKSGTSSLQEALWDSSEQLASVGVGMPFLGRGPSVRRLLRPLGWAASEGFTRTLDTEALQRLVRRVRRTPGEVVLISNEDLAEAGPEHVEAFLEVAEAAGVEPRIIITARDWAKQVPSEYQQLLKHRLTLTYDSFLQEVRDRQGVGEQFWRRQDLPDICERWAKNLDPASVHVIPVPSFHTDPEAVYRLFGEVVGFDHRILDIPSRDVNASFGVVEAELLRRLNVALGDQLTDYESEYTPAVRRVLIGRVIARGASGRITLPPEHLDWVRALSVQRLDALRERGYTLHGDPSLLVPPSSAAQPLPRFSEQEMAEAAISTLAEFAIRVFRDEQRARGRSGASAVTPEVSSPSGAGVN